MVVFIDAIIGGGKKEERKEGGGVGGRMAKSGMRERWGNCKPRKVKRRSFDVDSNGVERQARVPPLARNSDWRRGGGGEVEASRRHIANWLGGRTAEI